MTASELEQIVDFLSLIEEDYELNEFGDSYSVDPCPVCGNYGHFFVNPVTKKYASLAGCCKGGGAYAYLQEVKGMNEDEAYKKLLDLAGIEAKEEGEGKESTLKLQPLFFNALQRYADKKGINMTEFVEEMLKKAIPGEYFEKQP